VVGGALRNLCPRCRKTKVFHIVEMRSACAECGYVYEREPGYFTGAMVVSYVLAVPVLGAIVIGLIAFASLDAVPALLIGDAAYLALVPFIFRYSRVVWLHFDWAIDPEKAEPHG